MDGICTLANDRVYDQLVALLNSIEVNGGKETEEPKNGSPTVESPQKDKDGDEDGEKRQKDGNNQRDKDDDDDDD